MKIGKVAVIVLAAAALVQAAYLTYSFMHQTSDDGEDTPASFVCANPGCGAEFVLTRQALIEATQKSPDGAPCPKCGKATTKRAVACPSCQRALPLIGHGRVPSKCTYCGKAIAVDEKNVPFCPGG